QFLPSGTSAGYYVLGNTLFTNQFSPGDPVHTPSGLNSLNPLVTTALSDAVADLQAAGIPLDAAPRGWHYDVRAGKKISVHGGPGDLGLFNAVNFAWVPGKGYADIP